jgi:hypothetical protein
MPEKMTGSKCFSFPLPFLSKLDIERQGPAIILVEQACAAALAERQMLMRTVIMVNVE